MGRMRNLNGFPKKRLGVTDKRYHGWNSAGDGGTLMAILRRVSHNVWNIL